MNKEQIKEFFDFNETEYYIFDKYFSDLYNDKWFSYSKVGAELNLSRQAIQIATNKMREKIRLGNKAVFYETIKDKDLSLKEAKEAHRIFLRDIYEKCDYTKTKITTLDVDLRVYNVLSKVHKLDTLAQFINFMIKYLEASKTLKIPKLGPDSSKELLDNFKLLIEALFGNLNEVDEKWQLRG